MATTSPRNAICSQATPRVKGLITKTAALHISTDRSHLSSFVSAVVDNHHADPPAVLSQLSDALLATENATFTTAQRTASVLNFQQTFGQVLGTISLAPERTITFTSRTAPIPVTVLHTASYSVSVVLTLDSDKFTFPDGNTRALTLNRPTTPVRIQARARSSGDGLPVDVTLRTPDGAIGHRPHLGGGALHLHLHRGHWDHGVGRTDAAGLVGAHLAPLAPSAAPGPLTMAGTRAARRAPSSLATSATFVALGTGMSRLTGLLRFVALAWALGQTHLADAFNLANTTPNMLYDIVLGGVLSATFIPVFVGQLARRDEEDAFASISAVISVATVVLIITTVAALILAPDIITGLTALDAHAHAKQVHEITLERQAATELLRWFVVQVAAYGGFALATALLNTRRRFVAVAWAPIINNFVCIGVLIWFGLWAGRGAGLSSVEHHHSQLVLLGLGTSMGVVLQGLALIPSLRSARLSRLRWHWNLRDAALRQVVRLSGWTFGFVMANQIAQFVVILLAGTASGPDPVSSYTYAYAFMQMPYGVVAVTVMSVVAPDLAEKWSTGQPAGVRDPHCRRVGARCWRSSSRPRWPCSCWPSRRWHSCWATGTARRAETSDTGAALAMFALGLPGFCSYLYIVRVLQSMQRTKVAFYLYLVENAINVGLAIVLVHPLGVRGLALSLSIAYSAGALLGLALLRQWFGRLGTAAVWAPLRRVAYSTIAMGIVVLVVSNLTSANHGNALLVRVVGSVVAGGLAYAVVAVVTGRRQAVAHRRAARLGR